MPVRNPTTWLPPSGAGYVVEGSSNFLVTNLGNFLVTNTGNFLVTTPTTVTPKFDTAWTKTGKNDSSWINKTVTVSSADTIADSSAFQLADSSGNTVVDSGETLSGKSFTTWTASGI